MKGNEYSRRGFLARSLAGLSLAGLPAWYARDAEAAEADRIGQGPRRIGPNDRINIACIGPGGKKGGYRQGLGDTRGLAGQMGVQVVAVCDVDKTHAQQASEVFSNCAIFHDFREVLGKPDVDAVVIGTPDHWHAVVAVAALKAGKDVYCEKPLTLTVNEGKAIRAAQQKSGSVFQTGSQQRSDARFRLACELVRNGRIGAVKRVEARLPNGTKGGPFEAKPVPSDLDWNFWLGPAPMAEYVPERTHGTFRHWYEYSGGMMTDWGAHHLDITQWALGADDAGPLSVHAQGLLPAIPNGYNVATDFTVTYQYPKNVTVLAMHEGENGVKFEGENGWIFVSRGKIEASDPKLLSDPLPSDATRLYVSNNHHANFIDCVRQRKETICPAEVGHRSATVCHIGNISLRLGGRHLEWDAAKEEFKHDPEASRMLGRPYRGEWKLS